MAYDRRKSQRQDYLLVTVGIGVGQLIGYLHTGKVDWFKTVGLYSLCMAGVWATHWLLNRLFVMLDRRRLRAQARRIVSAMIGKPEDWNAH